MKHPNTIGWMEQCDQDAKGCSKELRQQVLTMLHDGKTIGETREHFGLSLAAVCGIVGMNINRHEYLTLNRTST
jgi:hypothetical protein